MKLYAWLALFAFVCAANAQVTLPTKADGTVNARLAWTHVKTANTALSGFHIQRLQGSTWTTVSTISVSTPTLNYSTVLTDLVPGTYAYRVVAYSAAESASSASVVAEVVLIATPVPPENVRPLST